MDDNSKNSILVIAHGIAIFLGLWGLAKVIPAIGIMFSLAITGTAAGFSIAPSMGTIASYGAAATGAILSIQIAVRITQAAKKEPLE
ncbi:MAG: hypothetical protein ABUK01_17685 [Leptospirales bacterium]